MKEMSANKQYIYIYINIIYLIYVSVRSPENLKQKASFRPALHPWTYSMYMKAKATISHQGALLGKGETGLLGHDHDVGEEAKDVKEAATQTSDVGLVEEGADQVTEGHYAQTVVTKVQEQEEAIAVREDAAVLQHQREDENGQQQVSGALQEPGKEVAEWIDSHHLHILWKNE